MTGSINGEGRKGFCWRFTSFFPMLRFIRLFTMLKKFLGPKCSILKLHLFKEHDFEQYNFHRLGYPLFEKLSQQRFFGDHFVWAADIQENAKECLYVDAVHYTAKMSKMLAEFIARSMKEKNLL